MIQSMTGYGKATAELPDKKINVEIKSLNSKAMDLSTRIAPAYREKEIEIRNEISKVLERGKADFSLWIEKKEGADAAPINKDVLKSYYSQLDSISRELGIPCPAPEDWLQLLLRMPDVMTKTEIQELTEEEWKAVHAAVAEAIGHLVDFRKQEGAALEKKFREKIANISSLLEKIAPYEKERVEKVKERITDALEKTLSVDYDKNRLEQELAKAHIEAKFAWDKGATETQMKDVLALIRQAQWRWDFGVASHGGSFHAPQEIQRVLSHGLDRAMQARLAISKVLAKHGYTDNVPMPDISTKDKAQEYIGLDMDAERAAKDNFLKTTAPAWLEKAKANNRLALK